MTRRTIPPSSPVLSLARQVAAIVRRDWEILILLATLISVIAMGLMSRQWELFAALFGSKAQQGDQAVNWVLRQINLPYWLLAIGLILYAHSLALVVFARYAAYGPDGFKRDGLGALLRRGWRATLQLLIIGAVILLPMVLIDAIVLMLHDKIGDFLTLILQVLVIASVLFVRLIALAAVHAAALDERTTALRLLGDLKDRQLSPSFQLFAGVFVLLQLPDIVVSPFLAGMIDSTTQGKWALLLTVGLSVFFGMILQMLGLLIARPLLARSGEIRD